MRKSYCWKDSSIDTVKKISEMELTSQIGIPCQPDEYTQYLEDYTKLLFEMNKIPEDFVNELNDIEKDFSSMKLKIKSYCDKLIVELENLRDEE